MDGVGKKITQRDVHVLCHMWMLDLKFGASVFKLEYP